jgi:hypothetical protein
METHNILLIALGVLIFWYMQNIYTNSIRYYRVVNIDGKIIKTNIPGALGKQSELVFSYRNNYWIINDDPKIIKTNISGILGKKFHTYGDTTKVNGDEIDVLFDTG